MRQVSQTELANIFFREIDGYLPKIDLGISTLRRLSGDKETLEEVYRYFHNIKGAASQVSHTSLSKSAGICEMLIGDLLENDKAPNDLLLEFLSLVSQNIGEFCELPEKSGAAEESLYSNTLSFFKSLMHQLGPDDPISVSSDILTMLPDMAGQATAAQEPITDSSAGNAHDKESVSHLDCLLSLRSVVPLLRELAEYSSEKETFQSVALPPMTRAVKTLAGLTASAGLKGHHALLSQFLVILIKLEKSPELSSSSTPELLQEFLSYLDLVFSMPPNEGQDAARKIQSHLDSLCSLLIRQAGTVESPADAEPPAAVTELDHDTPAKPLTAQPTGNRLESAAKILPQDDTDIFSEPLNDSIPTSQEDPIFSSFLDDELLLIFRSECEEHLQVIDENLSQLQTEISEITTISKPLREILALLRRASHTLKGAAAMTGFTAISQGAKILENYLGWLHDDSRTIGPADIELVAEATEAIKHLIASDSIANTPDLDALEIKISTHRKSFREPDAPTGGWKLEQSSDAAELFRQSQSKPNSAPAAERNFLLDIDEDDILLDLSSGEEPIDPAAMFQDEAILPAGDDGITDTTAQAQQVDPELLAIFQSECDEHLQTISTVLNSLTTSILDKTPVTPAIRESIASIRRAVHTLKGAAAMTGFEQLASCSHSLEDLLDWLHDSARNIEPQDLSVVAESIDIIESMSLVEKPSMTIDVDELINTIRDHYLRRSLAEDTAEAEAEAEEIQPEATVQSATIQDDTTRQPDASVIPGDSGNIRVKLADLDELVNIEGELVVVRGSVEKLLDKFSQSLAELNTVKDTLRRKSQELEVGFEAQSLYGFGSGAAPLDSDFAGNSTELSEFDPIELDRYSQLNLIIRSLNEISIDINAIYAEMTTLGTSLQGQVAKQQLAMGVMQEKLMRIRMTPLSSISRMLHRTVRQTAAKLGKNVQLSITGDDVYMDRFIWSRTIDPFSHILRNCIDHGIEDGGTREKLGKPQAGQITFHASQRGRFVVLKISDDGQGINTERLRQKLIDEQLIGERDKLTDAELLPYLFRPSITTREDVSQTSGRGVGLDVVLKNIQELRGTVQVHNTPGKGVTFELRIPITLSVNRAIIFSLNEKRFAVPIHDIVEVRKFSVSEIIEGEKVKWNEQTIPLVNLAQSLDLSAKHAESADVLTLVIEHSDNKYSAVQIDAIEEQREIVIKDLGSHLRYVRGINGVTLTGEGTIIPILNLHELATQDNQQSRVDYEEDVLIGSAEPLKVLVVDDSISVRYSLTRLVESQSWSSFQAVDGVDALEKLEILVPDVIVLDIEMPRMNGFEFMGIIRNDERYKDIPVVMLTSRASEKHQSKARELGVNHYMVKPFQEEDFIELMASINSNRA